MLLVYQYYDLNRNGCACSRLALQILLANMFVLQQLLLVKVFLLSILALSKKKLKFLLDFKIAIGISWHIVVLQMVYFCIADIKQTFTLHSALLTSSHLI